MQWQLRDSTEEMVADILQVRRSEKDFRLRRDMQYPDRVNKYLGIAADEVRFIQANSTDPGIVRLTEEMSRNIAAYKTGFKDFVDTSVERGLDHSSGIYGKFRKSAHAVEKALKDNKVTQAEIEYLVMRRNEKDYMLRGLNKYVERVPKNAAAIQEIVNADNMQKEVLGAFNSLANGDFTFEASSVIREPLAKANKALNKLVIQIKLTANNVYNHGNTVRSCSTGMSQKAIEQAISAKDAFNLVEAMTANIRQNSDNAKETVKNANQAAENAREGEGRQ